MNTNYEDEEREAVIKAAKDAGRSVCFSDDLTLQLDFDTEDALENGRTLITKFYKAIGVKMVLQSRSKSDRWHWYVYLAEPVERSQRMLLQGTLGSDPVRELLNWKTSSRYECFLIEATDGREIIHFERGST